MSKDQSKVETKRLVERFKKYVKIHSSSKDNVEDRFPSTPEQLKIAKILAEDLKNMGLGDVKMDEFGYVFATLPGNLPDNSKAPVVGLLAHYDTYPGAPGENVKPIEHSNYNGEDIVLPGDKDQIIRVKDNEDLKKYVGDTIITSDGTTLLGADDKAGVAEILEAVEILKTSSRPRATIRIGFTPDEEVGNGTAHFDLKTFGADFAYTADGSSAEEVEDETFCADSAIVKITGRDVHPGYAKGKMVNALRVLSRYVDLIPEGRCAEFTEKREGYVHPISVKGDVSEATVTFIVRDFTVDGLHEQENFLKHTAQMLMREYVNSKIEVEIKESYRNMKYDLKKNPKVVEMAMHAVEKVGLNAKLTSIRGGTDGSRLCAMGLLTPNLCGGGKNFHSKQEWIPVSVMEKCSQILVELVHLWGEQTK